MSVSILSKPLKLCNNNVANVCVSVARQYALIVILEVIDGEYKQKKFP